MATPFLIKDRYEIRTVLGRGGMGVVYHAFDTLMRRDVAVKTLRDVPSSVFVELFYRECTVLAAMVHPNIVEIFDMGEFEEEGVSKPYFVMPLLPGRTLHDLIYPAALPLSAYRCVDIICQACRGLQAAHDRGLLHRDIKPRNIFVMHDDAVKIIDFGVAHLIGNKSTGVRGTPQYMAPEQITFRALSNRSDIFSLATVTYEALTAVHPFLRNPDRRDSDSDIATAVTSFVPPLASELNPAVSRTLAQAVAKAMAKDPWSRFESAAAFADALQKALRNEGGETVSLSGARVRLERARRSFEQKDYVFASEIVTQLESEGYRDPEITQLRQQLDEIVQRERTARVLEAAIRYFENEEYTLAFRKVQEILEREPENASALALKKRIEGALTDQRVAELLRQAAEHLERADFTTARQAVQDALKLRPNDPRARQALNDVDARQKELLRQWQEEERLYQSAQAVWLEAKIETAIEILDQLAALTLRLNDKRDRVKEYKEFHKRVLAEHESLRSALEQARKYLEEDNLAAAQDLCDRNVARYTDHPDLLKLANDIAAQRERKAAAFRQSISDQLRQEPNLQAQIEILERGLSVQPADDYFEGELLRVRELRGKVDAAVEEARSLEEKGNLGEALEHWKGLREIYPLYPGLDEQIARATSAWNQQRAAAKASWVNRVQAALGEEDHALASRLLHQARDEFPDDRDLARLSSRTQREVDRFRKVDSLLVEARRCVEQGRLQDALTSLQQATELSRRSNQLKRNVFTTCVEQAEKIITVDWRIAEKMLQHVAQLDASLQVPTSVWEQIHREEREESIGRILDASTRTEAAGKLVEVRKALEQALRKHQNESRLQARLDSVESKLAAEQRQREQREKALDGLKALASELEQTEDPASAPDILKRGQSLAGEWAGDPELDRILNEIADQVSQYDRAAAALAQARIKHCINICAEILKHNPNHRLFLALEARAKAREQALAAEYGKRVEQLLADGQDLANRAHILEEALRQYPEDENFKEQLSEVRYKQDLVNTIAERAQNFERNGLMAEALDQWNSLESIYPIYPGVDEAIARCTRLLEQKREWEISSWIEQIRDALAKHDYASTSQRLKRAREQFSADTRLAELANIVQERLKRRSQAEQLLSEADKEFKGNRFPEARGCIHQALEAGRDEPDIPKLAAKTLIENSGQAVRTNAQLAESMIAEACSLDRGLKVPKELQSSLAEAHRREDFEQCLASVRTLEGKREFATALATARKFLTKYPGDKQARALIKRLQKEQAEAEKLNRASQQAVGQLAHRSKRLWLALALSAGVLCIAGLLFWSVRPAHSVQVHLMAPDGVSITVDQYSCVTPNCNVRLRPGRHELHAARDGYQSQSIPVDIRADSSAPLPINVALEPIKRASPAIPEMGTLVVKTNVPGAELLIDGNKYEQAPNSSTFRVPLPAKTHQVQAAREGYLPSDSVQVSVSKASETSVNLNLTPKPSLVEIRGGAPGTQVKIDGGFVGLISEGKTLTHSVPPGTHVVEFSRGGFITKRQPRRFEPGQTIFFVGTDADLEPIPPDAASIEAQDWARVSTSGNITGLQDFLRKYPSSPHATEAAKTIEQIEWDTLDKKSTRALQSFVDKYPQSPHNNEVQKLLTDLRQAERIRLEQSDWDSLDKTDKQAVEDFLGKHPAGVHSADAQNIVTDLTRKEKTAELERAEETAWKAVNLKDRASLQAFLRQFPAGRHSSDAQHAIANIAPPANPIRSADATAITAVLQAYAAAWNTKDADGILAVRPSLGRQFVRKALAGTQTMHMEITPTSPPKIQGDTATVVCKQKVDQTFAGGVEKHPETALTITLARRGNSWIIVSAN